LFDAQIDHALEGLARGASYSLKLAGILTRQFPERAVQVEICGMNKFHSRFPSDWRFRGVEGLHPVESTSSEAALGPSSVGSKLVDGCREIYRSWGFQ
jgi:hypothetical protein